MLPRGHRGVAGGADQLGESGGIEHDDALRAHVTTLQDARGLPADGIAGPLTLMALADDPPGPRLLRVLD